MQTSEAVDEPVQNPYGASRIKRGLAYLVAGKLLTSVGGIGTFVLLVRVLPVEEFAVYSIMFGLVDLVAAISSVGILHVVSRYVPEVYSRHLHTSLRRLVFGTLIMRLVVLGLFVAVLHANADTIGGVIGLEGWEWALKAYLFVVLSRVLAFTLFSALESMLHQAIAQMGFMLVTVSRFVILASLAYQGMLDLQTVIAVEIVTDLLGSMVMLIGLLRVLPRSGTPNSIDAEEDAGWIRNNIRRMADFGGKGYLQHMLLLPFGGPTDRLMVGSRLATADVALFGFAQWILDLMEKYLPAQMLIGMIRPVLTARWAANRDFGEIVFFTNLLLKINLLIIATGVVVVIAGAADVITFVTGGKYSEALPLLLTMLLLVALYSWRHVLDITTHTVERNEPLIWAHTVLNISVIPGWLMLPVIGVYALPVSHVVGMVTASLVLRWRLGKFGFVYHHDLKGIGRILTAMAAGSGSAWLTHLVLPWPVVVVCSVLVYGGCLLLLRPINAREIALLRDFRKRKEAAAEPAV